MTHKDFIQAFAIVKKDKSLDFELWENTQKELNVVDRTLLGKDIPCENGHSLYILRCMPETIRELINAGYELEMQAGRLIVEKGK